MQSTGHARAHLSQPMQVVRSNRWNPRYRGRTGTGFSGYSKYWANGLRRNDCTKYQRVTYIPRAIVPVARATFRNQVRMVGGEVGEVGGQGRKGIVSAGGPRPHPEARRARAPPPRPPGGSGGPASSVGARGLAPRARP